MTKAVCPSCKRSVEHRSGLDWCRDRQMSEAKLAEHLKRRAKKYRWEAAHAGRGWVGDQETGEGQFVTQMAPGWPDWTLAKAGHRLIFVELKREEGVLSPEQVVWLDLLNKCGAHAIVIRPSHLRLGILDTILREGSPIG